MQPLKSVFGVIGALIGILYCGGLLYYFINGSGSIQEADAIGLGPTMLGLGAIGLLFCIALVVRIVWIVANARSQDLSTRKRPDTSKYDDDSGFDADAVVARYMAQRPTEAATGSAPTDQSGGPARPSFGRKIARPS